MGGLTAQQKEKLWLGKHGIGRASLLAYSIGVRPPVIPLRLNLALPEGKGTGMVRFQRHPTFWLLELYLDVPGEAFHCYHPTMCCVLVAWDSPMDSEVIRTLPQFSNACRCCFSRSTCSVRPARRLEP